MKYNVSKVLTNNGYRIYVYNEEEEGIEEVGFVLEWQLNHKKAFEKSASLSTKFEIPLMNSSQDSIIEKGIPFIGIITKSGYIEYYDELTAEKYDYHHSYCLSEEGLEYYEQDSTLRFTYYEKEKEIVIKGIPSLSPFIDGCYQLKKLAELFFKHNIPRDTSIYVEQQYLNTQYEGKEIGKLFNFSGKL